MEISIPGTQDGTPLRRGVGGLCHLSKEIKPLNLTEQEKADLVAFLQALTGEEWSVTVPLVPE